MLNQPCIVDQVTNGACSEKIDSGESRLVLARAGNEKTKFLVSVS